MHVVWGKQFLRVWMAAKELFSLNHFRPARPLTLKWPSGSFQPEAGCNTRDNHIHSALCIVAFLINFSRAKSKSSTDSEPKTSKFSLISLWFPSYFSRFLCLYTTRYCTSYFMKTATTSRGKIAKVLPLSSPPWKRGATLIISFSGSLLALTTPGTRATRTICM